MTTPPIKTKPSASIFQGAGRAGQDGCLLRVVTLLQIWKGLCGGMVGQGTTKICLAANCGVALHRNKYVKMSHFGVNEDGCPKEVVMVQDLVMSLAVETIVVVFDSLGHQLDDAVVNVIMCCRGYVATQ